MKKREYIILIILLLWFWIVIYQNYRILNYDRVLDLRQAEIYKETVYKNMNGKIDRIENDYLDEIRSTLRASWRELNNNPTLNPQNYE